MLRAGQMLPIQLGHSAAKRCGPGALREGICDHIGFDYTGSLPELGEPDGGVCEADRKEYIAGVVIRQMQIKTE